MRTRRRRIAALAILGVALGLVAFAGWRALQPKIRLASEAEVRAKFDPRLMKAIPTDPKAQARYRRFTEALSRKELDAAAIRKILLHVIDEGPLEALPHSPMDFPLVARVEPVLKSYRAEVKTYAKSDPERSVLCMVDALRLQQAMLLSARSLTGSLMAMGGYRATTDACLGLLSSLDVRQTERVWKALAADGGYDEAIRMSVLSDAQGSEKNIPSFFNSSAEELQRTLRNVEGTYDALATAELSNKVYLAMLNGIDVPFSKADKSIDAELERLRATVPDKEDLAKLPDGLESKLREFEYRVRTNNHPNSWGVFLAGPPVGSVLQAIAKFRNERQMLHLGVALRLYELRHGRLPNSAQPLVTEGLLRALPRDFNDGSPLKFDPRTRVITSSTQSVSFG